MALTVEDCLAAIEAHTRGLAAAAVGNLARRIEHCPDWSMADLVWHLTSVHWFWNQVAAGPLTEEPADLVRPERPADDLLIPALHDAMTTMVATLRAADQGAPCWTWAERQDIGFITRHQVQEAAVHHFDAENALRLESDEPPHWAMDNRVAVDAVDEFLTCSVANPRWPMPDASPLGGTIWFCACVADDEPCPIWHITDGQPGTVSFETYPGRAPEVEGLVYGDHGDASGFLLWLYGRRSDDAVFEKHPASPGVDRGLLARFRTLTFTD